MGEKCIEHLKSWAARYCTVALLVHFVTIVDSEIYVVSSSEIELEDDYLDEDTPPEMKHAVYISSNNYLKKKKHHKDLFLYSLQQAPLRKNYEKYSNHPLPLIVNEAKPPEHKTEIVSKKQNSAFVLKALLLVGLPVLVGLYILILAKLMLGLKAIASTNALTIGILSTKYLLEKKHKSTHQGAALLPLYIPLAVSSILSTAGLLTGAAGLIGSLIGNITIAVNNTRPPNGGSTTARPPPPSTANPPPNEEREYYGAGVLHLPLANENGLITRTKFMTSTDDAPKENIFSNVTRRMTRTVKALFDKVYSGFRQSHFQTYIWKKSND
ncbi:uncharacterized protein LOC134217793 [Armigeres subalbatus]|uniref:uncharacterized protein LOC134217793 n=1 Tax=Armigeres subalbatus TaxID=124917 RepID=UPI002ED6559D